MLLQWSQYAEISLYTASVVIADVAVNHQNEFLLTGESPTVIAFSFQNAPEPLHGAVSRGGGVLVHFYTTIYRPYLFAGLAQ